MKYLVLECHPGYAVVLDEEGRFLKVADRRYQIGQTVTEVVPMQVPSQKKHKKWLAPLAAMAACLALVLGLTLPDLHQPYASVYVKINPEVRIDVDKKDRVVGLTGINQDGIALIDGYDYGKKRLDTVTDELVDRAMDMGYLQADGQITISLDSQDQTWIDHHCRSLQAHLQDKITVTVQVHHGAHGWDDDDGWIYYDPQEPNRVEIQPEWDDDDRDDHHGHHGG